jgi:hypothetical protein
MEFVYGDDAQPAADAQGSRQINCLKMIGQYDKCLKGSEWAIVEELTAFLSHFEDLTDIVSTKVTSLSLIHAADKKRDTEHHYH